MENIRLMEKKDVKEVCALEKNTFSRPWSEKSFLEAVEDESALYFVLETGEHLIGYCGFYLSFETADLCNILVGKEFRNRGLGERLFFHAVPFLQKKGVLRIMLEVRRSNLPAIRLYQKNGFQKIGERKKYYKEPEEDAIIMQLQLASLNGRLPKKR